MDLASTRRSKSVISLFFFERVCVCAEFFFSRKKYFFEWVEWTGYTIAGGGFYNFYPAAIFVINEISTMLPRFVPYISQEHKNVNLSWLLLMCFLGPSRENVGTKRSSARTYLIGEPRSLV